MAEESTSPMSPSGQKERFFQYFQVETTALLEQMDRLQDVSTVGGERSDGLDHCRAGIVRLQKEVQDASAYVPSYDQRVYVDAIKALKGKLAEVRSAILPKPKFSFSVKKNESAMDLTDITELSRQRNHSLPGYQTPLDSDPSSSVGTPPDGEPILVDDDNNPNLTSHGTLSHSLPDAESISDVRGRKVHLIDMPSSAPMNISYVQGCIVITQAESPKSPIPSLTLSSISNTILVAPLVTSSVHLTSISNCVIMLPSTQQFRMHDSHQCTVYLYCTSRPIIEGCSQIRFAPVPSGVRSMVGWEEKEEGQNLWSEVDDFSWLKKAKSANWQVLENSQTIGDSVWTRIFEDDPKTCDVDILLAEAGIEAAIQ
ncbi:hypothetical protein MMC25_004686 [Agyrium rufum]|nr:hypothetical protein [Agyrium rufum]